MRRALVAATAAALAACGGGGGGGGDTGVHTYHAAAPVGDFLTLTIDTGAHTIAYVNVTNGDSGTVSYTDRSDGGMDVTDPNGDLVLCYELPGKAVVCQGSALGASPTHASREPSLLFGVLDTPLVKDDLKGLGGVGYMQFRTKEGGMEVGHFTFDAAGNAAGNAYFPMNLVLPEGCYGKTMYNDLSISFDDFTDNATLGCVERTEVTTGGATQISRVFGTPSGDYMVDSPTGALFIWRDAASTSFDAAKAGSYTALVYSKHVTYNSGTETGSPTISTAAVQVGASGTITVTQGSTTVFDGVPLLPFAGSAWQGTTEVTDPTPGLFYFMDTSSTPNEPVFVTFFQNALAFSTFHPDTVAAACNQNAEYSYTYGIAVKAP